MTRIRKKIFTFDQARTHDELSRLEALSRVAYTLTATSRQLENFERFSANVDECVDEQPRRTVNELWDALQEGVRDVRTWSGALENVLSRIPGEDDYRQWVTLGALAENAMISLARSITCLLSFDATEAVAAAASAYEAAGFYADGIISWGGPPADEAEKVNSHVVVQRELERQARDLGILKAQSFKQAVSGLRMIAFAESLLSTEEIESLD